MRFSVYKGFFIPEIPKEPKQPFDVNVLFVFLLLTAFLLFASQADFVKPHVFALFYNKSSGMVGVNQ
jgi:hypothetical protein